MLEVPPVGSMIAFSKVGFGTTVPERVTTATHGAAAAHRRQLAARRACIRSALMALSDAPASDGLRDAKAGLFGGQ